MTYRNGRVIGLGAALGAGAALVVSAGLFAFWVVTGDVDLDFASAFLVADLVLFLPAGAIIGLVAAAIALPFAKRTELSGVAAGSLAAYALGGVAPAMLFGTPAAFIALLLVVLVASPPLVLFNLRRNRIVEFETPGPAPSP